MRRPFLALKPEGASEKNSGGGYKGVAFGDVTLEGLTYSDAALVTVLNVDPLTGMPG